MTFNGYNTIFFFATNNPTTQAMPAKKSAHHRNPLDLANNIHRLFRKDAGTLQMSNKCAFVLNSMVDHAIAELMRTADAMARVNHKKTITRQIMDNAIKLHVPKGLPSIGKIYPALVEHSEDKPAAYKKIFVAKKNGKDVAAMGIRLGRAGAIMKACSCMNASIDAKGLMVVYFHDIVDDLLSVMKDQLKKGEKRVDVRHIQAALWEIRADDDEAYMLRMFKGVFATTKPLVGKMTVEAGLLKPKKPKRKRRKTRRTGKGKGGKGKKMDKGKAYESFDEEESEEEESEEEMSDDEESVFEGFSDSEYED